VTAAVEYPVVSDRAVAILRDAGIPMTEAHTSAWSMSAGGHWVRVPLNSQLSWGYPVVTITRRELAALGLEVGPAWCVVCTSATEMRILCAELRAAEAVAMHAATELRILRSTQQYVAAERADHHAQSVLRGIVGELRELGPLIR